MQTKCEAESSREGGGLGGGVGGGAGAEGKLRNNKVK